MTSIESRTIQDFVELAITNLVQIESNLLKLGYKFANQYGAIGHLSERTNPALSRLKEEYDFVPNLLYAWYDRVEYVDFSQDNDQLLGPSEESVAGLGLNITLVFESLSTLRERQMLLKCNGYPYRSSDGRGFIPFGTFASNSMPKGVWLPDKLDDPIIYDDGAGPVSMSNELIQAIRAGGFPFWERMFSKRRISSPIPNLPKYHDILPTLLEGVISM